MTTRVATLPTRSEGMQAVLSARRAAKEQETILNSIASVEDDADPQQTALDKADDGIINFIDHWGHEEAVIALRKVECLALYTCAEPPIKDDLHDLWMLRQLVECVNDLSNARKSDALNLNKKIHVRRAKDQSSKADEALIGFIVEWGHMDALDALKRCEARAAYWQQHDVSVDDLTSMLFFRELLDLITVYETARSAFKRVHKGKTPERRDRVSVTVSVN